MFVHTSASGVLMALAGLIGSSTGGSVSDAYVETRVEDAFAEGATSLYVVVMLRGGSLGPLPELESQMADVAVAQQRVLDDLPPGGFDTIYLYRTFPGMTGWVDADGLERLRRHPDVHTITADAIGFATLAESRAFVGAEYLNRYGLTGRATTVAVLDSGIDTDHPDLAGDIAPGAWHFLAQGTNTGAGAEDDHGHGTAVSGVITSDGVIAPFGVAPDAAILPVKVLDANGAGFLSDWAAGVDYVTSNASSYSNLVAINMSFGTGTLFSACPCDGLPGAGAAFKAALDAAKAAGIALFSGSGNSGSCSSMSSPSCLGSVTSVAAVYDRDYGREPNSGNYSFTACFDATTQADQLTCFTARSPCNELAAPGRYVQTSTMGGTALWWTGTSFAAPHCAGLAALLRGVAPLSPDALVQLLKDTGHATVDPCATTPNPVRVDAQAALCSIAPELASGALRRATKISSSAGGFAGSLDDGDRLGTSLASPGDLDGDGIADLVVGAPEDDDGGANRGALWVLFMNADRSVGGQQKISETQGGFSGSLADGDQLGYAVTSLGDLSGDGTIEHAVGAPWDDGGGANRGAVWMLSLSAAGAVAAQSKIAAGLGGFSGPLADGATFGAGVARLADLDGNGVVDLAVGAPNDPDGGSARGAVWILLLDATGGVIGEQKISATTGGLVGTLDAGDSFGLSLADLGDLDGDGNRELAVGAPLDDDGGVDRGAVWVLSVDSTGAVLNERKISSTNGMPGLDDGDRFGVSVAALGHLAGSGDPQLLVGATLDDDGYAAVGAVWHLVLDSRGRVRATRKLGAAQCELTSRLDHVNLFGRSVAPLPRPGRASDIAVGALLDDDGGPDRGAVWLLTPRPLHLRRAPALSTAHTVDRP